MFLRPWVAFLTDAGVNITTMGDSEQLGVMPSLLREYVWAGYFGAVTVATLAVFLFAPLSVHFGLMVLVELISALVLRNSCLETIVSS